MAYYYPEPSHTFSEYLLIPGSETPMLIEKARKAGMTTAIRPSPSRSAEADRQYMACRVKPVFRPVAPG